MVVFASENLGYREIKRLAEFMLKVSDTGIPDDVPECFSYDMRRDEAYAITETDNEVWASDLED